MYQDKEKAVHDGSNGNNATTSDAPLERRIPQNAAASVPVPYPGRLPSSQSSAPFRTIIDKRSYEQVYRDEIMKRHNMVYVKPEQKKPPETTPHVREPDPSSIENQAMYTTTVYNITSHDVSNGRYNVSSGSTALQKPGGTVPLLKPSVSVSRPSMEVISVRKSFPDTYAKRLLEITKSGMKKVDIPSTTAPEGWLKMNYGSPHDVQAHTSTVVQHASDCVQNFPYQHGKEGISPGNRPQVYDAYQKDVYRRIQQKEERRKAPIPSLETFAQNGEAVRISKHRSNIMVSIIQPKVAPAAPARVYGSPTIVSDASRTTNLSETPPYAAGNEYERKRSNSSSSNTSTSSSTASIYVRIQNELKDISGDMAEPPPAHSVVKKSPSVATFASPTSREGQQSFVQDQVLNLDTKHNASQRGRSPTLLPVIPSQPSASYLQNKVISIPVPSPGQHRPVEMLQRVSAVTLQPPNTTGIPTTSQTIWSHLQNHNLQQLLAHVQAKQQQTHQQTPKSSRDMTVLDHVLELNRFISPKAEKYSECASRSGAEFPGSFQPNQGKPDPIAKRKSGPDDEGDVSRKRKPRSKPDRSSEPYLQNEPCYKVSSRLPRCRECGRSAATRSRHAQSIFCRFYAFRKLKYNKLGKLEVAGFADPYADPKESDIGLWSSNLTQVPIDLSVEKAKFLLGQVGYKFCELFHQEKEAHFEHLSADKTIAWKQAVFGVREMCDVCQTTLFNHHWVCATCGFVVCIDCYKWRKNGVIAIESTTKDKDSHGWLLCSAKEPHGQDQLMLTQIIPSNCLYKLVRQMHGICALLEIPLNCECPLSREPLFRKIKDKLEFIYPITVSGVRAEGDIFYGSFSEPIRAAPEPITRMVSITIKNIEQLTTEPQVDDNGALNNGEIEPSVACRIKFSKQFHEDARNNGRDDGCARGTSGNDDAGANGASNEKQSYSFEGFQTEIRTDGDHFDESRYKIGSGADKPSVGGVDDTIKPEEGTEQERETNNSHCNGNGCKDSAPAMNGSDLIKEEESTAVRCLQKTISAPEREVNGPQDHVTNECGAMNNCISTEGGNVEDVHEDKPNHQNAGGDWETIAMECSEESGTAPGQVAANGDSVQLAENTTNAIEQAVQTKAKKEQEPTSAAPVQYSEEDRFKPSPPIDPTTFAMIMKQMVKFDKTVDIVSTFERHMACEAGHLDDFVECISVRRERVRAFLTDFLNDFVFLRGQNSSDDLTGDRQLLEYNRTIKDGLRFRNKGERRMHLNESGPLYPEVAHEWLCNGKLLRLLDPLDVRNYQAFHDQWERGQPVMVSAVSSKMNMDLWVPESFGRDFGEQVNDLINCFNGKIVRGHPMKVFWEGFEQMRERLLDERERPMLLKLKDWPPGDDFAEMMPTRFYDLMRSLPLAEYTRREGRLNLASRLSSFFVRPDLGPKMYSAYGSALHPNKGTTNLHLDISDAVNVMVYVGAPADVPSTRYNEKILEVLNTEDCDYLTRERLRQRKDLPGALWHIYHAQDADKIRQLLNRIELERGGTIKANHDPIHDQKWYLDRNMRRRLQQEHGVEGYAIVQCAGDAIFIPAGAPHQVRNLHNCIKVAEDFVSPENISYCFKLTNEFRHLSKTHSNHEDKLQIKNIIYHTVKDAVSSITNPLIMMAEGSSSGS